MCRRCLLSTFAILLSLPWLPSTGAAGPDPFDQNHRLGRGVNIIGWDPLWRDRSKARFQDEHFRLIREAGFTNVRVVLQPFEYGRLDKDHKISDEWFKTVDWAVREARKNNLMVILDLHEYLKMADKPESQKDRFLAVWRQIAEHYKDAPREVLFEILNEPNGKLTAELWNQYLREALAVIRQTNPTRTVIIGPESWNAIAALDKLELPADDRNLIVTVHYYSPFEFTHQGTPWTGMAGKTGVHWEGTEKEKQAVIRDFDKAQQWAKRHNRPIFLGEFGAYDKADMPSRTRWTSFVVRTAEKLGWSWAYWQFDGDFIVYDIPRHKWVEPIREALVPREKAE